MLLLSQYRSEIVAIKLRANVELSVQVFFQLQIQPIDIPHCEELF